MFIASWIDDKSKNQNVDILLYVLRIYDYRLLDLSIAFDWEYRK